jgi:hypothetical protein
VNSLKMSNQSVEPIAIRSGLCCSGVSSFGHGFWWFNVTSPFVGGEAVARFGAAYAFFMRINNSEVFALTTLLLLSGCGHWPPIVETKSDIERLPASERSVRARGLTDGDISSLARLRQLRILDFSGGHAVKPASISDQGLTRLSELDLPQLETLKLGYCANMIGTRWGVFTRPV